MNLGRRDFLVTVLAIQFGALLFTVLDVSVARQIVVFLYLLFVPGMILLRILRLREMNAAETLLFSTGLSVAFLMLIGLLMNVLYPLIGISRPLTSSLLLATVSGIVLVLSLINYVQEKSFLAGVSTSISDLRISPQALFLVCLPFLSIIGTMLVNTSGDSTILLLLIIAISGVVISSVLSGKLVPSRLFPLVILSISISLLFHASLVSKYLIGYDVFREYYVFRLTNDAAYWNPVIWNRFIAPTTSDINTYNAMLSVTILPTIYSQLLNMEGIWIFKIIYPILFSLVPLGLYEIYKKQMRELPAFLSVFFFMASSLFYSRETLSIGRQMVGELFLVLLLYLVFDKKMATSRRPVLYIIFGAALVVSHYSLSYLFMFFVLFAMTFRYFLHFMKNTALKINKALTLTSIMSFMAMSLSWYIYTSASAPFEAFVKTITSVVSSIFIEPFNPGTRDPLVLRTFGIGTFSFLQEFGRYVQNVTQFFILLGFIRLVTKRKELKFELEYVVMSTASLAIIFMCIFLPYFSTGLNMSRFYHLSLFLLAPLCVLGGEILFNWLWKLKNVLSPHLKDVSYKKENYKLLCVSVILITFFIFEVGFVYEVTGDISHSVPLSMSRVNKVELYETYTYEQGFFSAKWLSKNADSTLKVFADVSNDLIAYGKVPLGGIFRLSTYSELGVGEYVYLGHLNINEGIIIGVDGIKNITEFSYLLSRADKIYSNGASDIYWGIGNQT